MGDENPIRTLGDYSRPSHEGYRNTIELPKWNNVVPLRSNTIQLVQNRCSFHELWSEEPNQHLKDFLKLMDSLDLDVANRERTRLTMDYAGEGRLRKISTKKAWDTIEELARYEDEGWNDPVVSEKESLNYENPDLEQLLGSMEYRVRILVEEAITLIGRSESIFGMSGNLMHQLPPEPSR
uniref:MAK10-like protein n=1 Tax=Tanacetum cinerariifolium TaxID=118510 RepID=A0A6L2P8H9_TANCI|nr:MAK10-like protein [Tanacetum cinerariifolium]